MASSYSIEEIVIKSEKTKKVKTRLLNKQRYLINRNAE